MFEPLHLLDSRHSSGCQDCAITKVRMSLHSQILQSVGRVNLKESIKHINEIFGIFMNFQAGIACVLMDNEEKATIEGIIREGHSEE